MMTVRYGTSILSLVALAALAACAPSVPDSGAGVGFGSYSDYQSRQDQRDQQLAGGTLPAPATVSSAPLSAVPALPGDKDSAERLAAETAAALNSGRAPVEASPSNPAPVAVNAAGISQENNFEEVSELRSIESDAAAIARNRAQYVVIQPTELPRRSGDGGPNIVEFALRTTNPKGVSLYRRSSLSFQNHERNCAQYASADQAQIEFLARGGPQRDRLSLDPDGDGFACSWDPRPFRSAVRN
jgi:hypothetical protein